MYGIICDHICVENRYGTAKVKVRCGANPERKKLNDNTDVTFQIVQITDKTGS